MTYLLHHGAYNDFREDKLMPAQFRAECRQFVVRSIGLLECAILAQDL